MNDCIWWDIILSSNIAYNFIASCPVARSCPTLCNPMDCSIPGFPLLHYLLELAQIHVLWVSDAIQPAHPLSSPSPPAFNLSQHQCLFQSVSSSNQVAKLLEFPASTSVLPMNIQGWFPLGLTGLISLLSEGLWRVSSSTTIQKHHFFLLHGQHSSWSNSHMHTWPLKKPQLWLHGALLAKWCLCFWIRCLGLS